ncbi:hypothetical protein [Novosphingobium beihaiensis]|uniref:Lipase (Class 3) n=1 Tax=Novosphingobium beihaiensis TaxID=2930389 RepID=A0ABT0BPK3_9SPHN|nr:hypothetical protein [Novosphingobium beihaiensis]MCJ2186783.1 hypothetical protein [Novosphingobium beihaiensis]
MDQRIGVLNSEYYGMVFLGLANAAYTDSGGTQEQAIADELEAAITDTAYLPALPELGQEGACSPQATVPGAWSLDWGPAFPVTWEAKLSNLIYIASYRDESGAPYFFVVGIRGTDISAGALSVLVQVFEDFAAFETIEWSKFFDEERLKLGAAVKTGPVPGGRVAQGSFDGAKDLLGSVNTPPEGQSQPSGTLQEALQHLLGQDNVVAGTPIVVTGHSLGGCQTQTIASYVQWLCPENTVIPHAFAPSTAGDVDFIADPVFGRGAFWFNTLDIVPWGYVTIASADTAPFPDSLPDPQPSDNPELGAEWAVRHLWTSYNWPPRDCGPPQPQPGPELPGKLLIEGLIDLKGKVLIGNRYARPDPGLYPDVLKKMDGYLPDEDTIREFYETLHGGDQEPEPVSGSGQPKWLDGITQLEWQHFPPNYQTLLWDNYQSSMVYFDYKSYPAGPVRLP